MIVEFEGDTIVGTVKSAMKPGDIFIYDARKQRFNIE